MKHPNGYGTVVKMNGNRRNPFVARKTVGWNEKKHPILKTIGYFPTREAGLIALAEYNRSPYNIDAQQITFAELYKRWTEKKFPKLGKSNQSSLKSAYTHCSSLYKIRYREIRAYHMQDAIDGCGYGYSTQAFIKNLFWHLDRFALELDLIDRSYSTLITSAPAPETEKVPFTENEINLLWSIQDQPWVDSILTFLYTGFRISELFDVRVADVDLEAGTIKGGTKTKAGKNRIVPIHSKIAVTIRKRISEGNEYLFTFDGTKVYSVRYYSVWHDIMKSVGLNHTPHECRHTFRSRLDSAGANKRCIDLIMGHKSKDVGERVYTHKTIQELREAIELMP